MCTILWAKDKATLLANIDLADAANENPDGVGIMYGAKGGKIVTAKAKDSGQWQTLLDAVPDKGMLAVHFRRCTSGGVSNDNAHPFLLDATGAALMHNGVVSGWGGGDRSDTRHLCETVLGRMPDMAAVEEAGLQLFRGSKCLLLSWDADKGIHYWHKWGSGWHKDDGWGQAGKWDFAQSSFVHRAETPEYAGNHRQYMRERKAQHDHWEAYQAYSAATGGKAGGAVDFDTWFASYLETESCGSILSIDRRSAKRSKRHSSDRLDVFIDAATQRSPIPTTSRAQFMAQQGALESDWADYVVRPSGDDSLDFRQWWAIRVAQRAAQATEAARWRALEAKAVDDIKAALPTTTTGDDTPTVVNVDKPDVDAVPVVADAVTEDTATLPKGRDVDGFLPPWEADGFTDAARWAAKYPHRAAKELTLMWEEMLSDIDTPIADR